jgi:hypothetical protein
VLPLRYAHKRSQNNEMKLARRPQAQSWLEIVWLSLHQLSQIFPSRDYFHYFQDICRYIEVNWERLAQGKERTSTWTNTVSSTITTHKRIFRPGQDQGFWGLRQRPHDETPVDVLERAKQTMVAQMEAQKLYIPTTTNGTPILNFPSSSLPSNSQEAVQSSQSPAPVQQVQQSAVSLIRRKRKTGWAEKRGNGNKAKRHTRPKKKDAHTVKLKFAFESKHRGDTRRPSKDETVSQSIEEDVDEVAKVQEVQRKEQERQKVKLMVVQQQQQSQQQLLQPQLKPLVHSLYERELQRRQNFLKLESNPPNPTNVFTSHSNSNSRGSNVCDRDNFTAESKIEDSDEYVDIEGESEFLEFDSYNHPIAQTNGISTCNPMETFAPHLDSLHHVDALFHDEFLSNSHYNSAGSYQFHETLDQLDPAWYQTLFV